MKERSVSRLLGFTYVAFVIGFAAVTTPQSSAQTTPTAQKQPAPAASMMPMPAASMMPVPAKDTVPHDARPMDALKSNPNGPAWLDKFNRHPSDSSMSSGGNMPMEPSMMMKSKMMKDMMKSKMMRSKMKRSKTKCSTCQKSMGM